MRVTGGEGLVNSFAVVVYIPDPLGGYLDALRRELVEGCSIRSHVTILPPRSLAIDSDRAWKKILKRSRESPPFSVELSNIELFPVTNVIYLSIAEGRSELLEMHDALNTGELAYPEPFNYQPHVTLALELDADQVSEKYELARRRWAAFRHERTFTLGPLTLVQQTADKRWVDLAQHNVGAPCRV